MSFTCIALAIVVAKFSYAEPHMQGYFKASFAWPTCHTIDVSQDAEQCQCCSRWMSGSTGATWRMDEAVGKRGRVRV